MIRQGSKLKNKLSITSLIGLAIFTIIFLSWYGGSYIQIALAIIGIIAGLLSIIFIIYYREFKLAVIPVFGIILCVVGALAKYFDVKGINDDYLVLAIPIILMMFFIYLYSTGEKNKNKWINIKYTLIIGGLGLFELLLAYLIFFTQH